MISGLRTRTSRRLLPVPRRNGDAVRTVRQRNVPRRTVPDRNAPYRTGTHRTTPCRTVSYRAFSYSTVPYSVIPSRTVPYRIAPHGLQRIAPKQPKQRLDACRRRTRTVGVVDASSRRRLRRLVRNVNFSSSQHDYSQCRLSDKKPRYWFQARFLASRKGVSERRKNKKKQEKIHITVTDTRYHPYIRNHTPHRIRHPGDNFGRF